MGAKAGHPRPTHPAQWGPDMHPVAGLDFDLTAPLIDHMTIEAEIAITVVNQHPTAIATGIVAAGIAHFAGRHGKNDRAVGHANVPGIDRTAAQMVIFIRRENATNHWQHPFAVARNSAPAKRRPKLRLYNCRTTGQPYERTEENQRPTSPHGFHLFIVPCYSMQNIDNFLSIRTPLVPNGLCVNSPLP